MAPGRALLYAFAPFEGDAVSHAASTQVEEFMDGLRARNPGQAVFLQAVREVVESVMPLVQSEQRYREGNILDRLTEPDRSISFRVTWEDDEGRPHTNRGYRVQFSNALGPYKGGLRFHPTVDLGVIKFLGFEQIFKNALTTLPLGGGKGGSDFDPKGKSDAEVMRFCHAFMTELVRYIGEDRDVPAGDIGVGAREIGYLFGQYKRLDGRFVGSITGKGLGWGGSLIRPEATGYGCVYFVHEMLKRNGEGFSGKTCAVSGSGNVALFTAEKLLELGAKVVTLSDSGGFIHDPDGLHSAKLAYAKDLKFVRRGRISEMAEEFGLEYHEGQRPWRVPVDIAFPSATQNEISGKDAEQLVSNGCMAIGEGANMPTSLEGIDVFQRAQILYAPGKASNAGGVSVSGLEQSQNAMRISWTAEEVDARLQKIMRRVHEQCVQFGVEGEHVDYVKGANLAGFARVADAMIAYGVM